MKQNYLTENIERIVVIACIIFVPSFILALLSFIPAKAADTTYMTGEYENFEYSELSDSINPAAVIIPAEPDPDNPYTPKPDPSEPDPSEVDENEPEGEYSLTYDAISRDPTKDKTAKGYYTENMINIDSAYPIFLYLLQNPDNNDVSETWYRTYVLGVLLPTGECVRLDPKEHAQYVNVREYMYASYYYSDDTVVRRDIYEDVPLENKHTSFSVYKEFDYETDGYVFDSLESAQAYFGNGNASGLLRDKLPDWDNSQSDYENIPAPKLYFKNRIPTKYTDLFGVSSGIIPQIEYDRTVELDEYYKFEVTNYSDDYYLEIKGRYYSVDDITVYKNLKTWKRDYETTIKGELTSWVSPNRKLLSTGEHNLLDYGNIAWNDFIKKYPVENRKISFKPTAAALYDSNGTMIEKMMLTLQGGGENPVEIYARFYTCILYTYPSPRDS